MKSTLTPLSLLLGAMTLTLCSCAIEPDASLDEASVFQGGKFDSLQSEGTWNCFTQEGQPAELTGEAGRVTCAMDDADFGRGSSVSMLLSHVYDDGRPSWTGAFDRQGDLVINEDWTWAGWVSFEGKPGFGQATGGFGLGFIDPSGVGWRGTCWDQLRSALIGECPDMGYDCRQGSSSEQYCNELESACIVSHLHQYARCKRWG